MSDYPENLTLKADTKSVEAALESSLPVIIWLSPEGYSSSVDMRKALETAAKKYKKQLSIFTVDVTENPSLGQRFEVGKHPLLIGWYDGEVVKRRNRPWATDIAGIADSLVQLLPADQLNTEAEESATDKEKVVNNKPIAVTDATFEADVLKSELPVLVDFWAEWCGPCRMVAPVLEKLAGEYAGKVRIAKVDVDNNPGLSNAFQIRSIPTLMFIKQGKIVGQTAGALPEPTLRNAIEQLLALEMPAA